MLKRRIIPCLDVRDGRVVKGIRFQGLRDAGDPVALACAYEAQGADEIVLLDVAATPAGRETARETVRAVRAGLSIPLTVGGGLRDVEDAARLLDAGADKVAFNTAAVLDPPLLGRCAARFGRQCVVLSLDVTRVGSDWEVVIRCGAERTGRDAMHWVREAQELGAGEVLLTSFDRDGTQDGYDLELLRTITGAVSIPVIASGGAGAPRDLVAAAAAGADAFLAASILHDRRWTVDRIKDELAEAGVEVRR